MKIEGQILHKGNGKTNCFNELKKKLTIKTFEWNTSCNNQHSRPFPSSFGVHELLLETPLAKHLSQANPLTDSHNQFFFLYYHYFLTGIEWGWTWTWIFIRKMDKK